MRLPAIAASAAMLLAAACNEGQPASAERNALAVEQNQQRLMNALPAPQLVTSLERANLIERLQRINQQNMSGFIYLISQGQVMASYPVRGKVTSLNAYLMAGESLYRDAGELGGGNVLIEQPDYDGAYGQNADGIFFFTADTNAYVEWAGEYLFSDQPLALNTQPRLERRVD